MLHYVGVNMNPIDNRRPGYPFGSFEDIRIQEMTRFMTNNKKIAEKKCDKRILMKMAKNIIKKRSKRNKIWGWKSALTYKCLDHFMPYVKNPYFVILFRNVADNAESLCRLYATNYGQNLKQTETIKKIINEQKEMISSILKYKNIPKIILKYEEIKDNYFKTCIRLAIFLDVKPDFMAFENLSNLYVDEKTRYEL